MSNCQVKIGLTGTILSGKSAALDIFKKFGAFTISSDEIVRELQQRENIKKEIFKIFKTTDKEVLAKQIFTNSAKRKQLERILHPRVMREAFARVKKTKNKIIVFEVPLLFEAGFEKYFDLTLCVTSSNKALAERVKKRGISANDFKLRAKAQMSGEEKAKRADMVILNDGSLKELEVKIKKIYKAIK
ncbi:Dephospho-CoA kinase [Elusimicrobium minutum Pei191]|uniref:Dephospho-CoA kinase n=1 Tax=Elusimicrobium minutum (strain Pei191) TaxID=445932 RepID=B2KCD3_ELUMP|nr:dephospho-CoA kinase [Elusimicrobium minutum]ACC98054.1 Dephospho-CoA kinase [Elusimicrobium minutum Pei191]